MRKIPTIYLRNPDHRDVVDTDRPNPECDWVFKGEGVPTRKYDGTCERLDEDGNWWARREVKRGKPTPANFIEEERDPNTGKTFGWVPVEQSPFRKFHREAVESGGEVIADLHGPGTYELIGPKINGNPESMLHHALVPHGRAVLDAGLSPLTLIEVCRSHGWEGVVWHHPDGRMAKLKVRDLPVEAA